MDLFIMLSLIYENLHARMMEISDKGRQLSMSEDAGRVAAM